MLPEIEKSFPRIEKEKIRYLHNAVNVKRFTMGEPDRDTLKRYMPFIKLEKLLLYVGRISRKKGVLDLVKSFSKVVKNEPSATLVLAGREEKCYADEIRRIVKELRLENNVIFLGPVPNKDVTHLMRACDLFVYSPIGGEGIPRAVLEAMACGKPVVATKISGIPEAVRDNETGYVVEIGDHKGFSDRVLKILRDKQLRERLGMNARALIEKEFNYKKIIPQLVQLIEELCRTSRVIST
jgi:glycosyltransferase involved in cell wall biosynthesis